MIKIWDYVTGVCVITLLGHDNTIKKIDYI